jgi:C4-dicarboxylate-specific signal transduction histidine kinase
VVRGFLNHIELWLSAAGVVVILLVPGLLLNQADASYWQAMAYTAIAVGVLHGLIFWLVRRRQRRVREKTLQEAHAMLRDGIQRQVAALLTMDARATEEQRRRLDGVFDSLVLLDHLLDSLSSERLRAWTASEEGRVELARPARATGQRPAPGLHIHGDSRN